MATSSTSRVTANGAAAGDVPASDAFARLAAFPAAVISDVQQGLGVIRPAIRSMTPGLRVAGPAHTVKCYPGSIITVHKALLESKPGEVLVVDGEGDDGAGALFGELMTLQARASGIAGIVIDGPIRDRRALAELGFPVFARCATPRVGTNRKVGKTQIPITCGGIVVRPGDLIVGDDDGVVVIPIEQVEAVLAGAEQVKAKEAGLRTGIQSGQQLGDLLGFRALIYGA